MTAANRACGVTPANRARGEAVSPIAGAPRRLCLTLGALAELETAFGVAGWEALGERLRATTAADLRGLLAILLRGGGEDAALADRATPREAADAIRLAFEAAAG